MHRYNRSSTRLMLLLYSQSPYHRDTPREYNILSYLSSTSDYSQTGARLYFETLCYYRVIVYINYAVELIIIVFVFETFISTRISAGRHLVLRAPRAHISIYYTQRYYNVLYDGSRFQTNFEQLRNV